jgi:hypothetical protein
VVDRAFSIFLSQASTGPGARSLEKPGGSLTIDGGGDRCVALSTKPIKTSRR